MSACCHASVRVKRTSNRAPTASRNRLDDAWLARLRTLPGNDAGQRRVWVVMHQNLIERLPLFRHRLRSSLTEADAVPVARSLYDHARTVWSQGEVVASNRLPAEAAVQS